MATRKRPKSFGLPLWRFGRTCSQILRRALLPHQLAVAKRIHSQRYFKQRHKPSLKCSRLEMPMLFSIPPPYQCPFNIRHSRWELLRSLRPPGGYQPLAGFDPATGQPFVQAATGLVIVGYDQQGQPIFSSPHRSGSLRSNRQSQKANCARDLCRSSPGAGRAWCAGSSGRCP